GSFGEVVAACEDTVGLEGPKWARIVRRIWARSRAIRPVPSPYYLARVRAKSPLSGIIGAGALLDALSNASALVRPMCVSLICTKLKSRAGSAAEAGLKARDDRTPPVTVQTRPVPAHAMHCRKPRRSTPSVPETSGPSASPA